MYDSGLTRRTARDQVRRTTPAPRRLFSEVLSHPSPSMSSVHFSPTSLSAPPSSSTIISLAATTPIPVSNFFSTLTDTPTTTSLSISSIPPISPKPRRSHAVQRFRNNRNNKPYSTLPSSTSISTLPSTPSSPSYNFLGFPAVKRPNSELLNSPETIPKIKQYLRDTETTTISSSPVHDTTDLVISADVHIDSTSPRSISTSTSFPISSDNPIVPAFNSENVSLSQISSSVPNSPSPTFTVDNPSSSPISSQTIPLPPPH